MDVDRAKAALRPCLLTLSEIVKAIGSRIRSRTPNIHRESTSTGTTILYE